jgi:glucokinase
MRENEHDVNSNPPTAESRDRVRFETSPMVLAGDIGGTKTLLGVFARTNGRRPHAVLVREFGTLDYPDLITMIAQFLSEPALRDGSIRSACFGVAGPVIRGTAELTNVPWKVQGRAVAERFDLSRVDLLNDLQAMAYGVTVLDESEVHELQHGEPLEGGNIGLIAAGTGLGEALLHNVEGRLIPSPSEGGHADFAARNDREIRLLRWLTAEHGRADVEGVLSGRGLVNIHRVTHDGECRSGAILDGPDAPAAITAAALERRCEACVEALEMFVEAYGAEAGNLALRVVSTGGLFVGGGIAPKILPALTDGRFMRSFRAKAPFESLLSAMPVKVVLNPESGLLGAAAFAAGVHFNAAPPA